MNKEFWNERYSESEFAYGKEANDFLKDQQFAEGSKVLCLAEGQGRNGIFLAENGCQVTCVDYSSEAVEKTNELAKERGVEVEAIQSDLNDYDLGKQKWDGIVIIFGHFPPDLRKKVHTKIYPALKNGGKLVLEAYHKDQLNFKTGGPMNELMLYSREELLEDLQEFKNIKIDEKTREVIEGKYHNGRAAVVQVVAVK
jgi:cyclopropane fatty-acyl-phospholipid synthase-like methyltransferase